MRERSPIAKEKGEPGVGSPERVGAYKNVTLGGGPVQRAPRGQGGEKWPPRGPGHLGNSQYNTD